MKKNIVIILAIVAVGGLSFYGGMSYEQNKSQNERQQRFQQFGQFPGRPGPGMTDQRNNRNQSGAGFAAGEVLSKDDTSVTVKLRDGGSKIIFLSQSTKIMKTSEGAPQDLAIGEQVVVNGNANADGSLTADMIQIRPSLP